MIGMGPYIPHAHTPLARMGGNFDAKEQLRLGLVMISLVRLMLKDVNIAATTALQVLDSTGREQGIGAGANIVMPNLTPVVYRESYCLYDNKPCLDTDAAECKSCLEFRIRKINREIGYNEWGDSPHFSKRKETERTPDFEPE